MIIVIRVPQSELNQLTIDTFFETFSFSLLQELYGPKQKRVGGRVFMGGQTGQGQ
jgi:hypothetical protein